MLHHEPYNDIKVKNNNGWFMLSQEHFIGHVTTTLNNTFTNNFETNGAPYACKASWSMTTTGNVENIDVFSTFSIFFNVDF